MGQKETKTLIDFLLSRIARQELELVNLRDENARLCAKRMGKGALIERYRASKTQQHVA